MDYETSIYLSSIRHPNVKEEESLSLTKSDKSLNGNQLQDNQMFRIMFVNATFLIQCCSEVESLT